jgi:hypothetical protein
VSGSPVTYEAVAAYDELIAFDAVGVIGTPSNNN